MTAIYFRRFLHSTLKMSSKVREVDIDPSGTFKYILIKITAKDTGGRVVTKEIVRGYKDCKFHTNINDKVNQELEGLKQGGDLIEYESKVLGGGKIEHEPEKKILKVFGESQGYGKADHGVSAEILRKNFPGYEVKCSEEV